MGRGFNMPWIGSPIYNGKGGQNIVDRRLEIPCLGGLIYHG